MKTVSRVPFTTVKTEGALLPADLLQRVADGHGLEGLQPADYHLAPNERLNEAINRAWNRCLGVWQGFDEQRHRLPASDAGTTLTRERWLLILLQEFGYGRLPYQGSLPLGTNGDAPHYPISHAWGHAPIHLITFRQDLDRRDAANQRSPHSLMQEYLNRAETSLWGFLSNGLRLRVLRANASLTRAAYVEFDLEAMMNGELYADFALLWLVCHQSRVEADRPAECWLERWSQEAAEQGTRALDALRDGVQEAISALGRGFLSHRANRDLKAALRTGELSAQDYYRQLLRLVYRLIFLFVAEDRDLLLLPDAPAEARLRYTGYYSVRRLRDLAEAQRGGPHPDLYRNLRLAFTLLRQGYAPLALPGLGSFLFSERSTPALDGADLANRDLLNAVRALAFTIEGRVRRPVDYKNLGAEELGSVYESLLELHPQLNADVGTFALDVAAGSERKTTGSYYTPSSLIRCLLDSALEPVVEDRLRQAGSDPAAREAAVLDIKIVDPAAGSGHFLIAAAHRLARHLARVRTGDEEPAPGELRAALRDVVRHCIHGVDINPMAVELCKVALWMESIDPGKPLSFLDRNIQCGNSLIGATPALLEKGIPDEAFTPIEGDDKAYCSEWRKRNRKERGQPSLFTYESQPWNRLGNLAASMMSLDAAGEDSVDDVQRKQAMYEDLVHSSDYRYGRLWADAWCAAFVWKKTKEFPYPITEEVFRRIEHNPFDVTPWMVEEIERLSDQYRFFHWHLAFPSVFWFKGKSYQPENDQMGWSGGFDVVLGNPPWERLNINQKEWFAGRSPAIAQARAGERRKLIKKLADEDSLLWESWQVALRHSDAVTHLIRNSSRYPLSGRGDINTYAAFAELSWSLISLSGRMGCVLPSGIATELTTQYFFGELVELGSLVSLYEFENEGFFSAGRGHMLRFALITLLNRKTPTVHADYLFQGLDLVELSDPQRHFVLTAAEIARINPNTRTCPIFRTKRDAEITKSIYEHVPILVNRRVSGSSHWCVELRRMIHLSDDIELLRTREQLEAQDWVLIGNQFVQSSRVMMPVLESKMIYQYNHRYGDYRQLSSGERPHRLPETPAHALKDPNHQVLPCYWVAEEEVSHRLSGLWGKNWLLGWRDVTDARASARTVISAIIPRSGVTGFHMIFLQTQAALAGILCANLSSFILDFVARQKVGNIHLTYGILEQLPILPPFAGSECPWLLGQLVTNWIHRRVLELAYTAWDLQPFAQDCGYDGPPFRWDEARRFLLRCELDAAYFHLYGIERDDVDYIMDTFPIVKRKDEAAHGEYRTKRVILEIYDKMQQAMDTGRPYQTRLDPPPADQRVAHPPKDE